MGNSKLIAVDLAKSVFQACVVDEHNQVLVNKALRRRKLSEFIAQQSATRVVMEACYSSHYWARTFQALGHEVQLIPAQHVKPFVRGSKNDANDALAIAEAAQRPHIRFVSVKTLAQQDLQGIHRIRERLIRAKTSLSNQTRGLLSEYGVVFAQGHAALIRALARLTDPDDTQVTSVMKQQLQKLSDEYQQLCARTKKLDQTIMTYAQSDEDCRRLMEIPGIGPVIATALVSAIGDGRQFATPREFGVWLGLTPRQHASGDKSMHGGITKRGDRYLRKQLVHGARAAKRWSASRDTEFGRWLKRLVDRRGVNKANVALAHKLAKWCWVVLARKESFVLPK